MAKNDLRIKPAEAKARVDSGQAIILDVVSSETWERMPRIVSGAIRIDPDYINDDYRVLPADKQIIAYCT
ncbi:MAG: hypothetical protein HYX85_01855 [Chloroflexi bacterium]|nr:hypothetical protein [Chloroflexota bacterium]